MTYDPRAVRTLFRDSNKNTAATVDTSISSYVLKGGTLLVNGQAIRIRAAGREVTQAGSFNVKFGATVLFTITPAIGAAWDIDVIVTRIGSTTQLAVGKTVTGAVVAAIAAAPGETLANDITVDFRGSVTAGGTLDLDYAQVERQTAI